MPVYSSAVFNFIPKTAMDFYHAIAREDHATVDKIIDDFFLPLDIAMGLRKNDQELRALINKGIAAVQADGTYAEIQKKYFGDQDIYNE